MILIIFVHIIYSWAGVYARSRINNMLKWAKIIETGASSVELGSYDRALYTEYNGTTYITISWILMEWDEYFVHKDNIWQTLVF